MFRLVCPFAVFALVMKPSLAAQMKRIRARPDSRLDMVQDVALFFEDAGIERQLWTEKDRIKMGVRRMQNFFEKAFTGFSMPIDPPVQPPVKPPTEPPTPQPVVQPTKSPTEEPTAKPITAPTSQPTDFELECEDMPREEVMLETLSKHTPEEELLDAGTPQGMAFEWLLENDAANVDPCTDTTVAQRYALATIYFATEGVNWSNSLGWLSGIEECSWQHVICDDDTAVVEEIDLSKFHFLALLCTQ